MRCSEQPFGRQHIVANLQKPNKNNNPVMVTVQSEPDGWAASGCGARGATTMSQTQSAPQPRCKRVHCKFTPPPPR